MEDKKTMAKKKKQAAKKAAKKASKKDVVVVASKIKAYIRGKGFMCGADAIQAMSDCVYCCMDHAMARAKANRRRTVKSQDV